MSARSRLMNFNLRFTPCRPVHPSQLYFDTVAGLIGASTDWLDIGCGTRIFRGVPLEHELQVVERAASVYGIDPSADHLLQNRSVPQDHLVCGSAYELPWADATFDLVTSSMVFEHLGEPRRCLDEALRVLRPGGALVVATPNKWAYDTLLARMVPSGLLARLTSWLEGRPCENVFPTFYRVNSAGDIRRLARKSGFNVVSVRHVLSKGVAFVIPALYQIEMAWMALLKLPVLRPLRPNLIVTFQRPLGPQEPASAASQSGGVLQHS